MEFFYIIYNESPSKFLFVETTLHGYCLFTKFDSRAKWFIEEDADELIKHLQQRKPKNHYAKVKVTQGNNDQAIRKETPGQQTSDHKSNPGQPTGEKQQGNGI